MCIGVFYSSRRAQTAFFPQKFYETKQYKKGEDPIDEWRKRREAGTISDLDDQYGDPKKIGGIPLPMPSFGVGGEFGVGGKVSTTIRTCAIDMFSFQTFCRWKPFDCECNSSQGSIVLLFYALESG